MNWNPIKRRAEVVESEVGRKPTGRLIWRDSFDGPYTVECRRHPFWKEDASYLLQNRDIDWRITGLHGVCAAAKFVEWKASLETEIDDFVYEADALSQADYDMALSLRQSWDWPIYPFDYGTVVRFERLAIHTAGDSERLVWSYIKRALHREFGKRAALMLLKAFPLEYESKVDEDSSAAFQKRLAAMVRLYRLRLGALPLPNRWGQKGWMWRPMRFDEEPGDNGE